MKKIGIFLGFGPNVSIKSEGIGRLIAFLIKGNLDNKNRTEKFVVMLPKWFIKQFKELLDDQKINIEDIEIITTKRKPFGLTIYNLLRKKDSNKQGRLKLFLINYIMNISNTKLRSTIMNLLEIFKSPKKLGQIFIYNNIVKIMNSKNIFEFLILIIVIIGICVLLLPFIIMYLCYKAFIKMIKKIFSYSTLNRFNYTKYIEKYMRKIYDSMISEELNNLVIIANKRNDIKSCFIPSMFWPETIGLKMKKIIAAPDIVYYDFPTQFTLRTHAEINDKIRKNLREADHIICYSNYVKQEHLIKKCGCASEKISVIKHANVELNKYLEVKKSIREYMSSEMKAQEILKNYFEKEYNIFFSNMGFKNIKYIIYSSQYRPHKNMFNLIKAFKKVCKDNFVEIKLVLTGFISNDQEIMKYIENNQLQNNIIQLYNIPTEVLAALNKFAILSINPTLFEGGFPFTFSEAFSVGTPSIMSEIDMIYSEIENESLKSLMLFNPYDIDDISKKIIWAIDNIELLYKEEEDLYNKFKERDWTKVVDEYCSVLRL